MQILPLQNAMGSQFGSGEWIKKTWKASKAFKEKS
jgi:hypothetical protein